MKVLVIGSGGREHAVIKTLKRTSLKPLEIYCAPGNGGIGDDATIVDIQAMDIENMVKFAKNNQIDLVCVTPDDPLYAGMVDAMEEEGIRAFGPNKAAAIIEGSKAFSKDLMQKYNIPTADYAVFENSDDALKYIEEQSYPIVLKADGLALGKGVLICNTIDEAKAGIKSIMVDRQFGTAGNKLVVEEFLEGSEVSILAFTDGITVKTMPSSQDHKRALDNDEGLNTGGMGTFTPSKNYTKEVEEFCKANVYSKTIEALNKEGRTFKGVLYFGLILTKNGPKVLEYNARFGDPETQVVLPRLKTSLIDIFEACIDQKLSDLNIEWTNDCAVCVVCASGGYPVKYTKGYKINGLDLVEDVTVFHAGTKKHDGDYVTNGGRVLGVTALASTMEEAREKAYSQVKRIEFKDMHYRTDIGIK